MARRQVFRIEGLRDLEKALIELPKAASRNILVRTLMRAGEPIEQDARAHAPELRGHLKRSVATATRLTRRQRALHRRQSTIEVFVGPGGHPQAITQEFGTAHHPPQRFLTPAWDANRMKALESIRDNLAASIERARARIARRAARLAAGR